jgi:serine/threonine-protein kinase RsbT
MTNDRTIHIRSEPDISIAIHVSKRVAAEMGFSDVEEMFVATAVSELGNNLFFHANGGVITVRTLTYPDRRGIEILSQDDGPGIEDINLAMTDGYSTAGSLGHGLGAVRRLMDEFKLESTPGKGTRIAARIWGSEAPKPR